MAARVLCCMTEVLLDRMPPVKMDTGNDGNNMWLAAVLKSGVGGRCLLVGSWLSR